MLKAKVLTSHLDEFGKIIVETEYTMPDGTIKLGKHRYHAFNFSRERVATDIKAYSESLMLQAYMKKKHAEFLTTKINDITSEITEAFVIIKVERKDKITGEIISPEESMTITLDDI